MKEIDTNYLESILYTFDLKDIENYKNQYLTDMSFTFYFKQCLKEKNLSKSEVIKRSGLEEHYAYQILQGRKKASRDKIICLCIGMNASVELTNKFLKLNNEGILYPKNYRDAIIMICLNKRICETWLVNEFLLEHQQKLLL